jgi:hypothetical protein
MTFQSFSWAVTMRVNSVPRPAPDLLYSKFAPRREAKRRLYQSLNIRTVLSAEIYAILKMSYLEPLTRTGYNL